jgi:hypothetical protein
LGIKIIIRALFKVKLTRVFIYTRAVILTKIFSK